MVVSRQDIAQLLRQSDITPTRQRQSIAALLLARPQHLSADQVLDGVRRQGVSVSKATVYNTLGLFARKGLIREVVVGAAKVFYDSTTRPHHHIYNIDTGALTDLEGDCRWLDGLPDLPAGTLIDGVEIVIRVRTAVVAERDS